MLIRTVLNRDFDILRDDAQVQAGFFRIGRVVFKTLYLSRWLIVAVERGM